jgi:hypothetical protein
MKKIMALFCKFCPVCIIARKFPRSKFAEVVKKKEKDCPFCRAYTDTYGQHLGSN